MLIKMDRLHSLPDKWLGARAVGWMFSETTGDWWLTSFTGDGKQVCASSRPNFIPCAEKQERAKSICRYINKHANNGGAWLAGYLSKDLPQEFYLLWKDRDGDIQIPIEFPQSFEELRDKWALDDFLFQADMAISQWGDHMSSLELSNAQRGSLVAGH